MGNDRTPKWKRRTPTNDPQILEEWKLLYEELIKVYQKSKVFEIIGERYGVSRQSIMYHLVPSYKEKHNKAPCNQWSVQKQDSKQRKRIIDYKIKYGKTRRNIDAAIRDCYQQKGNGTVFTMEEISENIEKRTGISFDPVTLTGLIKNHEAKKGKLLVEVPGYNNHVAHYSLSK